MGKSGGMDDEVVGQVVKSVALQNGDGEAMTYQSHRQLEPERQQIFASAFPECGGGAKVVEIVGKLGDETKEFTVVLTEDCQPPVPKLVTGTCQITYDDLTPSDCIEYAFSETPDQWAMTQVSLEALENYRGMKFEAWKNMLLQPHVRHNSGECFN